ncbi:MAG TPA: serine hydroxymethyltransferase [Candidatus Pacebacteria bacterium]|nr:MAG: Serine hydroxymethyltransferase [Microgenomates group bacterium GW2011_GWB1_45_17]KKU24207.1 MAG: Serine hydroxymethyltransferase [Microgenomates group bacterium GW2011_GWC1_46_15]KKU24923.1 MAG: Serine hydroxymethyltransferase [Microgenomates group bacterium GW2011_GWA1_46_15]HAV15319.1 serine hydroxymethyltransferase [Candidatus Paceibacterota bacterium]HCR92408.1 serine hydroxymethyltransferase [Candidatus Paceibacterota bacterium]
MISHDPLFTLIDKETRRQREGVQLIPSENFASENVRKAVGSPLMNKYSEGYPHRRYYEGNDIIDEIEDLAVKRACALFKVPHANVQPYSGSPANSAVLFGLLEAGDTIMGMKLASGGHLTHGHPGVTFSGKYFKTIQFGLNAHARIDLDEVRALAHHHKPKLMIIGTTAYPFILPFKEFAEIADEVGAFVLADISHIAGLIVAGVHPSPVPYADVVMTTTHKTLRGPRGAMLLVTERGLGKDPKLAEKIDKAVFPGLQGGPHDNVTAGIAVALGEAATPEFKTYGQQVVKNAVALANALKKHGITLMGGGTENHLMIMDFSAFGGGTQVAYAMAIVGMYANKNTIPNEPYSAFYPSGVRLGTPAVTTIGMKEKDMEKIAEWIAQVVEVVRPFVMPKEKEQRGEFVKKFRVEMEKSATLRTIKSKVKAFLSKSF